MKQENVVMGFQNSLMSAKIISIFFPSYILYYFYCFVCKSTSLVETTTEPGTKCSDNIYQILWLMAKPMFPNRLFLETSCTVTASDTFWRMSPQDTVNIVNSLTFTLGQLFASWKAYYNYTLQLYFWGLYVEPYSSISERVSN